MKHHVFPSERHFLQLPTVKQVCRAPFLRMRCSCMCGSLRLLEGSTVQFGSAVLMVLKAVKVFCYSGCASSSIIWCGWFRIQSYWAAVKYDLCRDWYCNSCPLRHFFFYFLNTQEFCRSTLEYPEMYYSALSALIHFKITYILFG